MKQFTLQELNNEILATLDTHLEPSYWLISEIADLRVNQRGHCYMELVQKDGEEIVAKMRANIWAYTFRKLGSWFEGVTGMPLKSGIKVLFNVQVQFHPVYGLSLTVRDVDPNFTLGERARNRQDVLIALENEGALKKNKQRSLPLVPQRIAIISSPTAAGLEDFMKQLHHNQYGYQFAVKLYNALMQGPEAEESIIGQLERIDNTAQDFDMVVIIRGGGSQVDLDCFDQLGLARAIASCSLPVITGIGHERDQSIADLVAHTDLHTPTAVGEFLVNGMMQFELNLLDKTKFMHKQYQARMKLEQERLDSYSYRTRASAASTIRLSDRHLESLASRLQSGVSTRLAQENDRLDQLMKQVDLLNPDRLLKRGYSLTTFNGKAVDETSLKKGDIIRTQTYKKIIESEVVKENTRNDL